VNKPNNDYWSKTSGLAKSNSVGRYSSPMKDLPKNPKEVLDETCSNASSKPTSSKWIANNLLKPVKLQSSPEKAKKAEAENNQKADTEKAQIAFQKRNIYGKKADIETPETFAPKIAENKEKFEAKTEVRAPMVNVGLDRKNI
jgi:hypothetical protein